MEGVAVSIVNGQVASWSEPSPFYAIVAPDTRSESHRGLKSGSEVKRHIEVVQTSYRRSLLSRITQPLLMFSHSTQSAGAFFSSV